MDFDNPFPACSHPGEVSRIWPLEIQREQKRQELLQCIQEEISPLTMQAKRKIMLSVRLLIQK